MSLSKLNLPEIFDSYKIWVNKNPQLVCDLETAIKWTSYFIAGRFNCSSVVSELIYSLSNLLVLFNDRIIENARINKKNNSIEHKLKLILTTIEYCEIFIEFSAKKFFGEAGKWFFITCVQIIKCIGRLLLTFHYKHTIVQSPPITALNRKNIDKDLAELAAEQNLNSSAVNGLIHSSHETGSSFKFVLKRSGRTVRKVEGAPPIHLRSWRPINEDESYDDYTSNSTGQIESSKSGRLLTTAELLYIFKPIIHLSGVGVFGLKSWKSYGLAVLLDMASLRLYYMKAGSLSKKQHIELSRRSLALLLYLLRSPMYEKFTESKLISMLNAVSSNVPFTKTICSTLGQYIPHWQTTYFYMWST